VFKAYAVLNEMTDIIASAQADARIRGFKFAGSTPVTETLGGYTLRIGGPIDTRGLFGAGTGAAAQAAPSSYGLVIHSGQDEFIVVAQGITLNFSAANQQVEYDWVQEGTYKAGVWVPGRTINGDERYFPIPRDSLKVIRFRLLRR
jgi:hypothetical protein